MLQAARREGHCALAGAVGLLFALLWLVTQPARAEDVPWRLALLIGNADYGDARENLRNPCRDVSALAAALQGAGFEVTQVCNRDRDQMTTDVDAFVARVRGRGAGGVALLYYAGHGVELDGRNYLVPVRHGIADANLLKSRAYRLDDAIEALEGTESLLNLLLVDACRDNPLPGARGGGRNFGARGMVMPPQTARTLIGYASAPGKQADDGDEHSPYARALLRELSSADEVLVMMNKVNRETARIASTRGRTQVGSLNQIVGFVPQVVLARGATRPDLPAPGDLRTGDVLVRSNVSGADVRVDGGLVGRTGVQPVHVRGLRAGSNARVEVSRSGYEVWSELVYVQPSEAGEVWAELRLVRSELEPARPTKVRPPEIPEWLQNRVDAWRHSLDGES